MDKDVISTRPAERPDAAALADLCAELGYPATAEQVLRRWTFAEDPEHTVLVAEREDTGVKGFIDVHVRRLLEADAFAEVGGLVVASSERRHGLGAALLAAAAEWARGQGVARLWIRTRAERHDAHAFYDRVGCLRVKDQHVFEYAL